MVRTVAGLSIVAVACLAACSAPPVEKDFRQDPTQSYVSANLKQVAFAPHQFLDTDIIFRAIYNGEDKGVFIPAYTPFMEHRHHSFSIWYKGTRLWNSDESMEGLVRTIFMRKDNPNLRKLVHIRRYAPIVIKGRVRSHFDGIPWIEAYDVTATDSPLYSREGLRAMLMGIDAANNRDLAKAEMELGRASRMMDTPEAGIEINLRLGRAYLSQKTLEGAQRAINHFSQAVRLSKDDPEIEAELTIAQYVWDLLERGETIDRIPGIEDVPEETEDGRNEVSREQLLGHIQKLDSQLRQRELELSNLREKVAGDEATAEALRIAEEQLGSLMNQLEVEKQAAADARDRLESLQTSGVESENAMRQLREDRDRAVEERDTATAELAQSHQKVQDSEAQLNELRQTFSDRESELSGKIEQLSAAKSEVEEQTRLLETQLNDANQQITSLREAMGEGDNELKTRINELTQQLADAKEASNQLSAELERLRGGGGDEEKVQELEAKLQALQDSNTQLLAEVERLQAGAAGAEGAAQKIADLEAANSALQSEIEALKAAGGGDEEAAKKIAELETANADLQKEIAALKESGGGGDPEAAAKLADAEAKLNDATSQLAQVRAELEDKQTVLSNYSEEIETLTQLIKDLRQTIKDQDELIKELQSDE